MSYYIEMDSPVGTLLVTCNDDGITGLQWDRKDVQGTQGHPLLTQARKQLDEYFKGKRTTFDLPLAPEGTDFQQAVWKQLRKIPYGHTKSYGEIASRVGNPKASRAVGAANGRNPISVIVPCHRVIGADGSLTGFGGGIERKRWLLNHERKATETNQILPLQQLCQGFLTAKGREEPPSIVCSSSRPFAVPRFRALPKPC